MNKKISQLVEATNPVSTDVFAIVNEGTTKKIQLGNLQNVVQKPLGWGRYNDSTWTELSPLPLLDGVKVKLNNNGNTKLEYGSDIFYDTTSQKVLAINENDTYIISVVFKAKAPNANTTHLDIDFYSPVGDFERLNKVLPFDKGNNEIQNFHEVFQYYADADLVNNGLEVEITADGGTATVWDIIFFIQRTQNNG